MSLFTRVIPGMLNADFWIKRAPDPDNVLLSLADIIDLNRLIRLALPEVMYDLAAFPAFVKGNQINTWVKQSGLSAKSLFCNSQPLSPLDLKFIEVRQNCQALPGTVKVNYGFTLTKTNLRTLPSDDFFADDPEDVLFDLCQETTIEPAQPIILLHTSSDNEWNFIQTQNYRGWVPAKPIAATCDRSIWADFHNSHKIVTTHKRVPFTMSPYCSGLVPVFSMGAHIPLAAEKPPLIDGQSSYACHAVSIPTITKDSSLGFRTYLVPFSSGVSPEVLPFTASNILTLAFRLLGERYGWGGMFDSWDCSSLIMSIYAVFGIKLPRNADQQAQIPCQSTDLTGLTGRQKTSVLSKLRPGAILHMPNHVMLYLGTYKGSHFVLHSLASACGPGAPGISPAVIPCHSVVVTDLSIRSKRTGLPFIEMLTKAQQLG